MNSNQITDDRQRRRVDGELSTPVGAPLQARDVHFRYATRRVLQGLDLELRSGEITTLLGANGAGKTTLLRCLAGLARPDRGSVLWFGRTAAGHTLDRSRIGFASHARGLYLDLTARENLELAARLCGLDEPRQRTARALALAGLATRADEPTRQFSQGMRQRLALVRAFLHAPQVRLLDEPFTHLDDAHREWLVTHMRGWRTDGATVLFTTHDRAAAQGLADRVLWLRGGKVCAEPATPGREVAA